MAESVEQVSAETLTFLFTDLEGSTRLWERYPDAMKGALKRHDTYPALKTLQQLIITGPTGTNVNDLYLLLVL